MLKFIVTYKDLGWAMRQNLSNYLHSIRKGKANDPRVKSAPSQNTEKRCKEDDEVPEHLQPDGKPSVGGKVGLHASCVRVNLLLDVLHKPKSSYGENVFGFSLPLLKTIGLDSGDPTNGLPKPAVDRRSCRTFHPSKLTRGGDVDFLKQPISNSYRDDDRDENWIGDTDYSDCPDDSEALSEEAVERCRDGKVDVVDVFCKSVHNPAFRVCVKEGHGRPEVQVDDMN